MDSIVYKIDLDCRRSESQAKIEAKSGEASGRKIIFSLYEGRSPYVVPNGVTAVFRAKKPSGAVLFNNCTITDDGNIEYVITTQTVAEVGIMPCELQLIQGGKVIFSPCFTMVVANNLAIDSEVESSDEFTELVEALESIPSTDDLVKKSGDTMTGNLVMGRNAILFDDGDGIYRTANEKIRIRAETGEGVLIGDGCISNILDVSGDTDAANKKYVDDVGFEIIDWVGDEVGAEIYRIKEDLALKADKDAIPTALPNPHKLTINGTDYDGSADVQMTIQGGGGESYDDTELRQRIGAIEAKESEWDAKQDAITDLATIRSGAALGATALQSVPNTYALKTDIPTADINANTAARHTHDNKALLDKIAEGGIGYTEGEATTIEWDGDKSGRDEIHIHTSYYDIYFYKVAEKEPSYSNTATCTINNNGETIVSEFELTDYTGCRVYGDDYSAIAIIADGGEFKISDALTGNAPTAGLYFLRAEYENDDGEGTVINYPSSLTYTAETIHKIDTKYLPIYDGGVR